MDIPKEFYNYWLKVPCWVGDTRYDSISEAARAWGIHKTTALNRIRRDGYPQWREG